MYKEHENSSTLFRAAHKIHPSFSSAILHIPITLLDIYRSIRKVAFQPRESKNE
jgi:hypothetical protein